MTTTITDYVHHLERRNLRPTYRHHQQLMLRRLSGFLDGRGVKLLDASTADLDAYLDSRGYSPSSRDTEIANLRSFYTWAVDSELVARNPARALVRPRVPRRLPRPMPTDDLARALADAPCAVAPILAFAAYAGLRACEIAQLRAEDITTDPPLIVVRESKGGGESTVTLAPALQAVLVRCPLPVTGWLFPGRNGKHLSRERICQIANRYLRAQGFTHTLHALRHTFGTQVYRATLDLRLTQELMRHRSVQSTVGYTQVDEAAKLAAVAQLSWDL